MYIENWELVVWVFGLGWALGVAGGVITTRATVGWLSTRSKSPGDIHLYLPSSTDSSEESLSSKVSYGRLCATSRDFGRSNVQKG